MLVFILFECLILEVFFVFYDLGCLWDFCGIVEGFENSNFFVSLEYGEFVLILVECGLVQDLLFFIELFDVFYEDGLLVFYVLCICDGEVLCCFEGKLVLL